MRTMDAETYLVRRRKWQAVPLPPRRERLRRRPRTPQSRRVIAAIVHQRLEAWRRSGVLRQVGPREYVIRLDRIPYG